MQPWSHLKATLHGVSGCKLYQVSSKVAAPTKAEHMHILWAGGNMKHTPQKCCAHQHSHGNLKCSMKSVFQLKKYLENTHSSTVHYTRPKQNYLSHYSKTSNCGIHIAKYFTAMRMNDSQVSINLWTNLTIVLLSEKPTPAPEAHIPHADGVQKSAEQSDSRTAVLLLGGLSGCWWYNAPKMGQVTP